MSAALKRPGHKEFFLDEDLFARTFLSDAMKVETPQFHKHMYKLLADTSKRYVAIIAPRGHAKSTLSSLTVPLHRLLYGREKNILIISETEDQAKDHLSSLKSELEQNELIRSYFPKLHFTKWTEEKIIVQGGPFNIDCQIVVKGSKQKIRGHKYKNQRPTLIIMDDVEGEDNMTNEDVRNDLKRRIDAAIIPALDPQIGRLFMIGTIVHYDSYLNEIYTSADRPNQSVGTAGDWYYVFYKAIENYGTKQEKALWPEWQPLKRLHSERIRMAKNGREYIWWQEYMNEPTAGSSQLFKPEYFKQRHNYHIRHIGGINWLCKPDGTPVRNCQVFIGVDPAISTSRKADKFAMAVIAVDHLDNRYLIRLVLTRIGSASGQANLIIENAMSHNAIGVAIETTAYQQALATQVKERMHKAGNYFRIFEFKPRDRKNERLRSLEYPISQGRLLFPKNTSDTDPIAQAITQFTQYPRSKNDDAMDAIYYAYEITQAPPKVARSQAIPKDQQPKIPLVKEHNWKTL